MPTPKIFRFGSAALLGIALSCWIAECPAESNAKMPRIRMGLSESVFGDLNENDARAFLKAWSTSVAAAANLALAGDPQLLRSDEVIHAIANHLIDGFFITVPEYAKVSRFVDPVIFIGETEARNQAEYVLLVRQDSGIRDLSGLRGRTLLIYQHISMSMSPAWLEIMLAAANFEPPDRFFGRSTKSAKVAQTVLPVFFGRVDACLLTRSAFDMMCEMNPQLRQKLQIIVVSPKLLPGIVGLHKDLPAELKRKIREDFVRMSQNPGGLQLLTLFQIKSLVAVDSSIFRASLDLLSAYDRLKAQRLAKTR